jgi:hypothetical protein
LIPRYARVNPLRQKLSHILKTLKSQGWTVRRLKKMIPQFKYRKLVSRMEPLKCFVGEKYIYLCIKFNKNVVDPHIENLLIFPRGTDLHDHPLVKEGALILQDKVLFILKQ